MLIGPFDLALTRRLFGLFFKMPGQLFEHVFEHGVEWVMQAVPQDAILLGFLGDRLHFLSAFEVHRLLPLFIPLTDGDEVVLQPRHWIAERPFFTLLRGAVARRVIRGGVPFSAVSEVFNQRRALVRPGPVRRPLLRSVAGERIIAVDPQTSKAIS